MALDIAQQIVDRVANRIPLEPHPDFRDLATLVALNGAEVGGITVYQAAKLEKFTIGAISMAPGMDYCSITVRPQPWYEIPKLGINYMVAGDRIQFDVDLYPPMDLVPRQDYVDTWYDRLQETYLAAKATPQFNWRVSDHSWMRLNSSPYFFMSAAAREDREQVDRLVLAYVDVWLQIHAAQERVAAAAAERMAAYRGWLDRWLREREPERHLIVKQFGEDLTCRMSDAMI